MTFIELKKNFYTQCFLSLVINYFFPNLLNMSLIYLIIPLRWILQKNIFPDVKLNLKAISRYYKKET